jgi:hypothetical protein
MRAISAGIALAAAALFFAPAAAQAERVRLESGLVLEGPLLARDFDRLTYATDLGRLRIPRRLIVERSEGGEDAPGPSARAQEKVLAAIEAGALDGLDEEELRAALALALGAGSPPRPRAELLAAIARAPEGRAEAVLALALFSERAWARREAARLLGERGSGPSLPALMESILDRDAALAALATEAAAHVALRTREPDRARADLAAELGPRPGRFPLYARFLARLGTEGARGELLALARSGDEAEREAALDALPLAEGVAGDTASAIETFASAQGAPVRAAAARCLGGLLDLAAIGPLVASLDGNDPPSVRAEVLRALERLTGERPGSDRAAWEPVAARAAEALEGLDRALAEGASEEPARRAAAASALGRVRDRRAVAALAALVADPDARVAAAACRALGALGFSRAVPQLVAALRGGPDEVRAAAHRSLVRITGEPLPADAAAWEAWAARRR